jgi:WD40 repeat protein
MRKRSLFQERGLYIAFLCLAFCQIVYGQQVISPSDPLFNQRPKFIWTIDRSLDDSKIATGGDDSLLRIYDGTTLKLLNVYKINSMIRQVSWSQKNKFLAIATNADATSILNTETGSFMQLKGIGYGARAIGWNFTAELIATADNNGEVKIWDTQGILLKTIKKEDSNSYFALDWHPAKNMLVVTGDDIRIMDTSGATLKIIKNRKEATGVLTVKWNPSGKFFATGDYGHDNENVKSILQFWKEDGTLIKTMYGSKAEYRNIQWNKEGTYLASASDALRIWNSTGELLYTGKSADLLWGLDWDSNSDSIITASFKGGINLWTKHARLVKAITE